MDETLSLCAICHQGFPPETMATINDIERRLSGDHAEERVVHQFWVCMDCYTTLDLRESWGCDADAAQS